MTGPYALVGARLVERGYAAIPIIPGTKRPGELRRGEWIGKTNWSNEYTKRKPSNWEIQLWSKSEAGVGVVCGPASGNLVGVDIDTDDPAIRAAIISVLPPTTVKKSGAKGETLFYRGTHVEPATPGGTLSPSWNIDNKRVCDFLGAGRQTLLPPTIHPDTKQPYRWTGPDALEDVDPDELPELPADIITRIGEALTPLGWTAEVKYKPLAPGEVGDSEHPYRQVNDLAMANFDAWVPLLNLYRCKRTRDGYEAVATWRASNGGNPIEKRKLNLKIHKNGIKDFGDGPRPYTPINLWAAACGCDPSRAFNDLADAVGWGTESVSIAEFDTPSETAPEAPPVSVPAEPVDRADELAKLDGWAPDDDGEAESNEAESNAANPLVDEPLQALTKCPGLVGDIIDWITGTSRRPNRVLALGPALTLVGTLIGRRAASPTTSATHLYVVTLAPTGGGKQHAKDSIYRLLTAAGAGLHDGPSEFISMQAVFNRILEQTLSLCVQDEWGAFLKRANNKRGNSFENQISKVFREMWATSFAPYKTPESAGRKSETIHSPALSICAFSTFTEFYDALGGDDVTNGFLNRILVLSTKYRAPDRKPALLLPRVVPERLAMDMQELYSWGGGETSTGRLNDPTVEPEPDERPWASDAAEEVYEEYQAHIDKLMVKNEKLKPFIARAAEIAVRLATIRAAGRWGHTCQVDVSDMEWGRDIANISVEVMARDALRNMVHDTTLGQLRNKVINVIETRKKVTHRNLSRAINEHIKTDKDLKNIIDVLEGGGFITVEKRIPKTGGPTSTIYRWSEAD